MWRAPLVFKRSYVESIHVLIRVLFCTLGIQELLWHLPHFLRVWFLTDFDVEFLVGKPQQENEMCKCVQLLLERITQLWIIKCHDPLILGSLMSVIFMLRIKKKGSNIWSRDLTICIFFDPRSKKPWSHGFDLSNSCYHVVMILVKPWSKKKRS